MQGTGTGCENTAKVSKFLTEIPETLWRAALSDPEGRAATVSKFSIRDTKVSQFPKEIRRI
jgi:hypothetical protein